ncbi:MAG: hypothetical protein HC878_15320 [Leptolyngbyaceae cyanobacterium SL_5_14]|nr:hypothetical protein [Leptolyngbyaceae cyanobacterium SL_5_14]
MQSIATRSKETQRISQKKLKVLIDQTLIIDILLERQCESLDDTENLLNLISHQEIDGYTTQRGMAEIHLLMTELHGEEGADAIEHKIKQYLKIFELSKDIILEACDIPLPEFKSTLQLVHLRRNNLDAIITLNPDRFSGGQVRDNVPVFSPAQFLNRYYGLDDLLGILEDEQETEKNVETLQASWSLSDGIIDEKLELGSNWLLDKAVLRTATDNVSEAIITIYNSETKKILTESAHAEGAVESACQALDALVKKAYPDYDLPQYGFLNFSASNSPHEGASAPVQAEVSVICGGEIYLDDYTHRNTDKAIFFAYVKNVDEILKDVESGKISHPPSANLAQPTSQYYSAHKQNFFLTDSDSDKSSFNEVRQKANDFTRSPFSPEEVACLMKQMEETQAQLLQSMVITQTRLLQSMVMMKRRMKKQDQKSPHPSNWFKRFGNKELPSHSTHLRNKVHYDYNLVIKMGFRSLKWLFLFLIGFLIACIMSSSLQAKSVMEMLIMIMPAILPHLTGLTLCVMVGATLSRVASVTLDSVAE